MMKLGAWVDALYENPEFELWGHSPHHRVRTPTNVALGYNVGKISAGCLGFSNY